MPEPLFTLTPDQRAQLRALWIARATTSGNARLFVEVAGLDTGRLHLLERMGFVALHKPSAAKTTRYYLTPLGVAEARKPSEARHG